IVLGDDRDPRPLARTDASPHRRREPSHALLDEDPRPRDRFGDPLGRTMLLETELRVGVNVEGELADALLGGIHVTIEGFVIETHGGGWMHRKCDVVDKAAAQARIFLTAVATSLPFTI